MDNNNFQKLVYDYVGHIVQVGSTAIHATENSYMYMYMHM